MQTQHEFFQQHAVDGILPDHLMGQMLTLPEGETTFTLPVKEDGASPSADEEGSTQAAAAADPKTGDAPNPEATPAATAAPAPAATPAPAPVILAKDGVHTIPYEKLEEERRERQQAQAEAARLAAENEALKRAQAAAPAAAPAVPAAAPAANTETVDFGDYSDEAMQRAVAQVAERAAAKATAPLLAQLEQLKGQLGEAEKQAEVDATRAHFTAVYTAHPDLDSILESAEFAAWKKAQPAFVQPAIDATIDGGTAQEVIELFATYKGSTGRTTPAASPAAAPAQPDAAALAAARVAAAKPAVPTSLSEIPAGTTAHHDEAAAMLEMSPTAVMAKFHGKSPEQIAALMDRVL